VRIERLSTAGRSVPMRNAVLALSISVLAACGSASSDPLDASGASPDAASTAGPDAAGVAALDAGLPSDAADLPVDAALSEGDAATAGADAAAAGADAASAGPDAGLSFPACAAAFAGCADYTDATATDAARTITFSGGSYTPKCLKLRQGQAVTFSGTFSSHPLEQSCGPVGAIAAVNAGKTATYTLGAAGDYGYFCNFHGDATGSGMSGSIRVVP
jgi:plastocyanin